MNPYDDKIKEEKHLINKVIDVVFVIMAILLMWGIVAGIFSIKEEEKHGQNHKSNDFNSEIIERGAEQGSQR
jgi:hypothetical protein